jgi:hypothetical protein
VKGDPSSPKADPFKRFNTALKEIVSVSKEELLKREAAYKRQRARKKRHPAR